MFSKYFSNQIEEYNVGNLVTLTSYFSNIKPFIISVLDSYYLKLIFIEQLGYSQGTLVDFTSCLPIDSINDCTIKKLYKNVTD